MENVILFQHLLQDLKHADRKEFETPGVNFTNILRAAFTYVSCEHSFFVPTF
jgi:hypothetical protein